MSLIFDELVDFFTLRKIVLTLNCVTYSKSAVVMLATQIVNLNMT